MARFVVGIDLGTTNCGVAFVDTEAEGKGDITVMPLPQVTAPGEVAERPTLPSFALLPNEHEVAPAAMALPWDDGPQFAVGSMARDRGSELPHRLISSAKSWLSYTGVDRTAAILPWRGEAAAGDEATRLSPVEASSRYLAHIRAAWDHQRPDHPLAQQDIFLTVPASFDAVARELTAVAAREAGLGTVTLLEEPQAAFYSWLAHSGDEWRDKLSAGDVVLVCDVGGGTTDFSLMAVNDDAGNLAIERVAVGDHILLGGDNMDLALSHGVVQRLGGKGKKLKPMQRRALIHACRRAKEQLLATEPPENVPISILGSGSKLIGGTIRTQLERSDVETLLLEGFFPVVAAAAKTKQRRAVGLKELGLPYASDPGITRHLAEFVARHGRQPTAMLWNGGVMKGELLRERLGTIVGDWFGGAPLPSLAGTDLDLAVAHGAAYYGLVRRGKGIRIRGGTARAY
jgi:molecular chaperone DnaK (HSP70)